MSNSEKIVDDELWFLNEIQKEDISKKDLEDLLSLIKIKRFSSAGKLMTAWGKIPEVS
jgi:hypothetical protein